MNGKAVVYGVGAITALVAGFLVLDYVRRSDPEYKQRVKARRKQSRAEAKRACQNREKKAQAHAAAQAKAAAQQAAQAKLAMELEEGRKAMIQEDNSKASRHFAQAIRMSENPTEVAIYLKTNLEDALFEMIMSHLDSEVFRDKYFDTFPGEESGLNIKVVEGEKQRGVYALKDYKAGDVITTELPFVGSLLPECVGNTHCSFCFAKISGPPLSPSSRGVSESYCSANCREEALQSYPQLLNDLGAYSKLLELCKASGQAHGLIVAKLLSKIFTPGCTTEHTTGVAHLHLVEPLPAITATMKEECAQVKKLLKGGAEPVEQLISEESYVAMVAKVQNNEIVINIGGEPVAKALYFIGSYFNHSCTPNVKVVCASDNHCVSYVATKNIKAGEEVTRSYIDTAGKTAAERKQQLSSRYKFTCDCGSCKEGATL